MTISIDKLKNGIRVITEEIPSIESVSVGIWINAGSKQIANNIKRNKIEKNLKIIPMYPTNV